MYLDYFSSGGTIFDAKSSKIFTAYRTQRDTNFKHEISRVRKGSFSMSFTAAKKTGLR